jgi:hypothetical protein
MTNPKSRQPKKIHSHKWEWLEAKMRGAKYSSGMMQVCQCGTVKTVVNEKVSIRGGQFIPYAK